MRKRHHYNAIGVEQRHVMGNLIIGVVRLGFIIIAIGLLSYFHNNPKYGFKLEDQRELQTRVEEALQAEDAPDGEIVEEEVLP